MLIYRKSLSAPYLVVLIMRFVPKSISLPNKKYNTKLTLPKFSESVIVQPAVTLLDKYAYYNF